jgi:hypothetical protein
MFSFRLILRSKRQEKYKKTQKKTINFVFVRVPLSKKKVFKKTRKCPINFIVKLIFFLLKINNMAKTK